MSANIHARPILILDFGSQYSQLIARRVREIGVYCELHPYHMSEEAIRAFKPAGIILTGGPESVSAEATPRAPAVAFELGCPVLGICYGMQTMAAQLGGVVATSDLREYGYARVQVSGDGGQLFHDIVDHTDEKGHGYLDVWMSHGDRVEKLPHGFSVLAATHNAPLAAIVDKQRHFYGLQFHPEVTHTLQGHRILERFVREICGCAALWTVEHIADDLIEKVRQQVGRDKVILGLSGGVDSSVVAALLHKAIGDQLTCIFVDHGLLRAKEADQVMSTMQKHLGIRVVKASESQRFFDALSGINDPEQKRKIIGKLFIEVFDEYAHQISDVKWLAQGTIYSDVIESADTGSGTAHVIKSHHNVGGLPKHMKLKLVEPLRELFKDEVRKLGLQLSLSHELLYRHPFPGPGLAVRILGEVKPEYVAILQKADAIFIEELLSHDLYQKVSQAFAVFLPVKSVGVLGDARHYDYVIALRAVETLDFMTARWAQLPYDFLAHVANRIINEVKNVSRVTYDISSKPPATIEWE